MPHASTQWTCLRDRRFLERDEHQLFCPDCGRRHPLVDDVADFRRASERGSASETSALDELLALVDASGVEAAAAAFCRRDGCRREDTATDWRGFVGAPRAGRILEIGAGFGDDTLAFARGGAEVVSLVPSLRNARVVRRRLARGASLQVRLAVVRDLTRIPLPSASVDTITVEEVGLGAFGVRPHGLWEVVAEWKRVLKPTGNLVLAQANRFYRIPPVGALRGRVLGDGPPETLNRRVKRLAGAGEEPSLGLRSTLRCLAAHGFARPTLHAPLPDAGDVEIILPIEDRDVVRYCFGQLLRQNGWAMRRAIGLVHTLARFNLLRALVPHYYVLCSASVDSRSRR